MEKGLRVGEGDVGSPESRGQPEEAGLSMDGNTPGHEAVARESHLDVAVLLLVDS
jgi:hypothetical protein